MASGMLDALSLMLIISGGSSGTSTNSAAYAMSLTTVYALAAASIAKDVVIMWPASTGGGGGGGGGGAGGGGEREPITTPWDESEADKLRAKQDALRDIEIEERAAREGPSGPYSDIPDPARVEPYRRFSDSQRQKILEANRIRNGGVPTSDNSGQVIKGTPHVDHIDARSRGGTNSNSNAQVLTEQENLQKGNR